MSKRARTSYAGDVSGRSRAFRIYRPKGFPYRKYGAMYIERGTPDGIAAMGRTWRAATPAQRAMRKSVGFVGRGSYRSIARAVGAAGRTSLGRLARRSAIGYVDAETGGLGSLMAKSIKQYRGRGMYTGRGKYTAGNLLMAGGAGSVAGFSSASDETGALTISHREYVTDIYGLDTGETFHLTALRLNPGLHATFPWLSQIAANYEEYELIQLVFEFESKISDQLGGTNGQVGSIIMFTDYGPDSALKTSKYTMLQGYASGDALLTNNLVHGVECDPKKLHGDGHKYVRTRAIEGSLNDFDLGITQIGVSGTPVALTNQIVGQLYVNYTVKLMKPRIYSALALAVDQDIWSSNGAHADGAQIFTRPLMPGVENAIGTLLQITQEGTHVNNALQQAGDLQKVTLTFPASFAGPVEIIITTEAPSAGAGNLIGQSSPTVSNAPTLAGNVAPINDILNSFAVSNDANSQNAGFMQEASGYEGRIARFHYNVEMADSGVDNSITFSLRQVSTADGVDGPITKSVMEIRRYNSRESSKPPLFLDSAGNAVIL